MVQHFVTVEVESNLAGELLAEFTLHDTHMELEVYDNTGWLVYSASDAGTDENLHVFFSRLYDYLNASDMVLAGQLIADIIDTGDPWANIRVIGH